MFMHTVEVYAIPHCQSFISPLMINPHNKQTIRNKTYFYVRLHYVNNFVRVRLIVIKKYY